MNLSIIVAVDNNMLIGSGNRLPWEIKGDLKYFKETTRGHTVIMGRKTYGSIGKPLPERRNLVLSRDREFSIRGCRVLNSLKQALEFIEEIDDELFIIGGSEIYKLFLPWANKIYLTKVDHSFEGDTFFPKINWEEWEKVKEEEGEFGEDDFCDYRHYLYRRVASK